MGRGDRCRKGDLLLLIVPYVADRWFDLPSSLSASFPSGVRGVEVEAWDDGRRSRDFPTSFRSFFPFLY